MSSTNGTLASLAHGMHYSEFPPPTSSSSQRTSGFQTFYAISPLILPEDFEIEFPLLNCLDGEKARLSEETILNRLKRRGFGSDLKDKEQVSNICVVCQEEYKKNEIIGRLQCGHEYHSDCIKNWLLLKNVCPLCKAIGLLDTNTIC